MNNFIKSIIEEKFASKAQQRYFYAQAGKGGKKGKKWSNLAKEFSDKTDFEKIPEKVENNESKDKISPKKQFTINLENEQDIDEIVDEKGNIMTKKIPRGIKASGITQRKITDKVVKTGAASMGTHGVHGTHTSLRYWAENRQELKKLIESSLDEIEMKDALGFDKTLNKDATYEEAYKYFRNELKLSHEETIERLKNLGYDVNLKKGKVRLIENPKKFIEEFIESIIAKKNSDYELVNSYNKEIKEINPIIKRQLKSFKETLENNNLSIDDVLEYLKNNE